MKQSTILRVNSLSAAHLFDSRIFYQNLKKKWLEVQKHLTRANASKKFTLTEKILYTHLTSPKPELLEEWLKLKPDRIAMQDASAQMALLQFITCKLKTVDVAASIHCDHLIVAKDGEKPDLKRAVEENMEIFEFLRSCAKKYGIDFWGPGSGIIHQIVLENYAIPGGLMLGTDSHTPNAGGLNMMAIGVGGADAVDAMTNTPWELKKPKVINVRLENKLDGWTSPKDVILYLAGQLTVRGGTGHVIEYSGPGAETLSATGMATICNMGAEVGATTSIFPYSQKMKEYLEATNRTSIAKEATELNSAFKLLEADEGAEYDKQIVIDLAKLQPHINGPFTPDLSTPLSTLWTAIEKNNWPTKMSAGLIGSCTNSSFEDMSRVANIIEQANKANLKPKVPLFVTPGSEKIRATIESVGITKTLKDAGAKILANACGPCIGMWDRVNEKPEEPNAILTSFNRNFRSRNDGNPSTMNFLSSPEIVAAKIYSDDLSFDPTRDVLDNNGVAFKFEPPVGTSLPMKGFKEGHPHYKPKSGAGPIESVGIYIDPKSKRLELLEPFDAWDGKEFEVLIPFKVKGKCTTDHISAAGKWLKFKGHLSNINNNTLIGAMNAETEKVNHAIFEGKESTIPDLLHRLKDRGTSWMVVAEFNYGEGSAREHAALQPRSLGGKIILTKSFARIHETNLKKQGILPLTFTNPEDYDRLKSGDVIKTKGLVELVQNGEGRIKLVIFRDNRLVDTIDVEHTMSLDQLAWFKAGSALNHIRLEKEAENNRPIRASGKNKGRAIERHDMHNYNEPKRVKEELSAEQLMSVMRTQGNYYAKIHIHSQAYTVTKGDTVTIPNNLRDLRVGDVLELYRISLLGTRDYIMRGKPLIKSDLFTCSAIVVEKTRSEMMSFTKTKMRNRRDKVVQQKQPYTKIRITDLRLLNHDEPSQKASNDQFSDYTYKAAEPVEPVEPEI